MWPECFAHTRGGVGAGAAGGEPELRVPAPPPRWQALPATRCLGGRATRVGGGGRRDARRAPRPPPGPALPPPGPARRGMAGCAARPPLSSPLAGAVPLCPRARRSFLPWRAGRGRKGGGGPLGRGRGRGKALLLAGCAARHPPRGWPWLGPAPRPARHAPRPAQRAGGWPALARQRGTPAPPLPAGRRGAPLPKGPPQPFAAEGWQGAGGGGRTAGAGAGAGGGAAAGRLRGPASAPRLAVARASR
jgi:hypothetical protein